MTTTRGPTSSGVSGSELGAVTTVVDQQLVWDAVNNLTATIDHRDAAEWPAGHRPQTTLIGHDSLYRVIAADFAYTQLDGSRTDYDAGSDWRSEYGQTYASDPMRQEPAPMVADTTSANRVVSLTWSWDYLANQTSWTDDSHAFYERSLGAITNGNDESGQRPSAIYLASNIDLGTGPGAGWVEVDYGDGGNVTAMTVHGQCVDVSAGSCTDDPTTGTSSSRRTALRAGCSCAVEQHYVYRWDELNRLAEARRYDREVGVGRRVGREGPPALPVRRREPAHGEADARPGRLRPNRVDVRATASPFTRTRATSSGAGSCAGSTRTRRTTCSGPRRSTSSPGRGWCGSTRWVVRGWSTTGATGSGCRSGT